jgi:hypothetical protein
MNAASMQEVRNTLKHDLKNVKGKEHLENTEEDGY